MQPKEFITEIAKQNSTYNYRSQAENVANSLNTISSDIYSESKRFIYELIQNADDACEAGSTVTVEIEFVDSYLIVSHTGRKFSQADIEAICSIGKSQKIANTSQTGYKGIGFKSVFGQSDWVYIRSNHFCFRFDRTYWSTHPHSMPWQIIPIWTENSSLPHSVRARVNADDFSVVTVLQHSNIEKLKDEVLELLDMTQIMIFLRNVQVIVVKSESQLVLERVQCSTSNLVTLKRNGAVESQWLTKDIDLEIDDVTRETLQDDKLPKKLRDANRSRLSFAGKIENGKLVELNQGPRLFAYLPTQVNLELPVLVNGDFVTNAAREQLHSDLQWNQWLMIHTASHLLNWIAQLAHDQRYRFQITHFMPSYLYERSLIENSFNLGLKAALKIIPFVPTDKDELSTLEAAILDKTEIHTVLDRSVFIQYVNQQSKINQAVKQAFVHPSMEFTKKLVDLGITTFNSDQLEKLFKHTIIQAVVDSEVSWKLIKFFYQQYAKASNKDIWSSRLKSVAFILDQSGQPTAPNQPLYFPPQVTLNVFDSIAQHFHFIHEDLLQRIKVSSEIQQWLQKDLQLSEPTPRSIAQRIILPRIEELTATPEQSLITIRYLFSLFQHGSLKEEQFKQLASAKLVTTTGHLLTADNCYLSDRYQPEVPLESQRSSDGITYSEKLRVFVSEAYLIEDSSVKEWNLFLTRMGVHEKPGLVCKQDRQSCTYFKERYPDYINHVFEKHISSTQYASYRHQHSIQNFTAATFHSLICTDPNYSKLFWNFIFPRIQTLVQTLKTLPTQYWVWNGSNFFKVPSHFDFMIFEKPCFPTTLGDCRKSADIFINAQELREIAGDCLPVLDLEVEIPTKFIQALKIRTQMTVQDCLSVLSHLSTSSHDSNIAKLELRVSRIYAALSQFEDEQSSSLIQDWASNHTILACDGNFYKPTELYHVQFDQFDSSSEEHRFVAVSKPDERIVAVLTQMGVQIVESEQMSLNVSEDLCSAIDFKAQLQSRLPTIALVVAAKRHTDWALIFESLSRRLEQVQLYQATHLAIEFVENDRSLLRQSRKTWASDNQLYFVGSWRSARVLYALATALCHLLDICGVEREIDVLLRESLQSGLEWLEEMGYKTDSLRLFLQESNAESNIVDEIPLQRVDDHKTDERTVEQRQRDAETGQQGEIFVFEELQRYLIQTYQSINVQHEKTSTGFRIGEVEVIWENIRVRSVEPYQYDFVESGKAYDFRIIYRNAVTYIDAKSTTLPQEQAENCFYLSPNEWKLMCSNSHKYYIARVFHTRVSPTLKIIKMESTNLEKLIEG